MVTINLSEEKLLVLFGPQLRSVPSKAHPSYMYVTSLDEYFTPPCE